MKIDRNSLKKIPNSEDQTCFGCGSKNHDGLQMEFYTDDQLLYSFLKIPVGIPPACGNKGSPAIAGRVPSGKNFFTKKL